MDQQLDRELVERILAGDTDAFNLLVWRWQRPLYNFLLRLSGNREQARDLSQDAFLRAYTRLRELREAEKFGPWLFRIAVNLHRSEQRSPQAQQPTLEPAEDDLVRDADARELQLTVRALLERLTPEQREVVVLKVYQGFRFDEISTILDLPLSTVKTRLYKAFDLLRQGLEARIRS